MKEIELNSFYSWDYDEALAWLEEKQKAVLSGAAMQFAVGSHARAVVTLGRHTPDHQFIDRKKLLEENILIRRINRGGGMTAHEPGQIILYPVVSLS